MIHSLTWMNQHLISQFGDDAEPQSLELGYAEQLVEFVTISHPTTSVLQQYAGKYLLAEIGADLESICSGGELRREMLEDLP